VTEDGKCDFCVSAKDKGVSWWLADLVLVSADSTWFVNCLFDTILQVRILKGLGG